jgi:hypothetical protein
MAKLEKPLFFSSYRDRGFVYGHGSNSQNESCEINSFNEELQNPDLCMVCATTRFDPLLPYIGNKLGYGREYYKQFCTTEQDFQSKGSTGFISRGPALYGLYLAKVNAFYEQHLDHVMFATQQMQQDQTLLYMPFVLHVSWYGKELEYPSNIINIAEQLIKIRDQQLEQGKIVSFNNLTVDQKNLHNKLVEFLQKKPNWEERKIAHDNYVENSNRAGTVEIDPILPFNDELDINEDTNLDEFFYSPGTEIPF